MKVFYRLGTRPNILLGLLDFNSQLYEQINLISMLWMRHRETKKFAQGCIANKWRSWDLNPGSLTGLYNPNLGTILLSK